MSSVDDASPLQFPESRFSRLTVSALMERHVQSGMKDTKATLLASYMMEGFGSVPIIDTANQLVGIVSEYDLLQAVRKGKDLNKMKAGEIMTSNSISVTQDTDILTVLDVLQNNHLIRLPVVDSVGKLIGIVARRDILRGYLHSTS